MPFTDIKFMEYPNGQGSDIFYQHNILCLIIHKLQLFCKQPKTMQILFHFISNSQKLCKFCSISHQTAKNYADFVPFHTKQPKTMQILFHFIQNSQKLCKFCSIFKNPVAQRGFRQNLQYFFKFQLPSGCAVIKDIIF